MAAPQIPNLTTLRNPRGNRPLGRARGGGGDGPSTATTDEEARAAKDKIVQQTDQDASISRLSAVDLGYLHDPFAREFVHGGRQRRFPIINRGTYVRTKAIDDLINSFLSAHPSTTKQIISLGAGSDTRPFRLLSRSPMPSLVYHEIDFPTNTSSKISTIVNSSLLSHTITAPLTTTTISLASPTYHIHSLDLRTLSPSSPPIPHIDPSFPTLLISECCLIYLLPTLADSVINYFTSLIPAPTPLGLILYEPINPFSAFGRVMVSNLAARGIELRTLHKYSSLEAQRERLKMYGFVGGQGAKDINALWEEVGREEKERVGRLELVDEVEEWELLAGHYCVAWGWRDGEGEGFWEGWREKGRD